MGYLPADARWFLAEIIQQITVEGDPQSVIHINSVLVRADSAEEAFIKSNDLGHRSETSYVNPAGKAVRISFRGLHGLDVIHEELRHGAELAYTERVETDEAAIQELVCAKEDLAVFAPIRRPERPDYGSLEVLDKLLGKYPDVRRPGSETDV